MCESRTITMLDYGAGNLTSVRLAFERLGAAVCRAERAAGVPDSGPVVFPGVGSAAPCMAALRERGFDQLLREAFTAGRPVLGICLGMQLLFERSAEDGGTAALGLLPGECRLFDFGSCHALKIPEIGWNAVHFPRSRAVHPCLDGIPDGTAFYFVHSYYVNASRNDDICGLTEYGGREFTSAAGCGSFFATQFHPERSGEWGLKLLDNFLEWSGRRLC